MSLHLIKIDLMVIFLYPWSAATPSCILGSCWHTSGKGRCSIVRLSVSPEDSEPADSSEKLAPDRAAAYKMSADSLQSKNAEYVKRALDKAAAYKQLKGASKNSGDAAAKDRSSKRQPDMQVFSIQELLAPEQQKNDADSTNLITENVNYEKQVETDREVSTTETMNKKLHDPKSDYVRKALERATAYRQSTKRSESASESKLENSKIMAQDLFAKPLNPESYAGLKYSTKSENVKEDSKESTTEEVGDQRDETWEQRDETSDETAHEILSTAPDEKNENEVPQEPESDTVSTNQITSNDLKSEAETPDVKATEVKDKKVPAEIEIEIITRDGIIKRKVTNPGDSFSLEIRKKGMEFTGLGFADEKKRGTPAGLYAGFDRPQGSLPKVEIITRDGSSSSADSGELYKPKVSTWGVFPRPANISKAYGGGRTIQPGEELETEEEKQQSEARSARLLREYRKEMGLEIDPAVKLACQKSMSEGVELMKSSKLSDAIKCFEEIMEKMAYQTDAHGFAALEKAACLESLSRTPEAKKMYEKLLSHPNYSVKKKAKQFMFCFQAEKKLQISSTTFDSQLYHQYLDSFTARYGTYNSTYKSSKDAGSNSSSNGAEILLISAVLLLPILLLLSLLLKH